MFEALPAAAGSRRPGFFGPYTKVNRCLTEGRQALAVRLAGIQGGIECAKLAPQLSALADGEASAEDIAALRPHLKTCLACRAKLREFRAAPKRVAAVVPPAALLAAGPGGGPLRGLVEAVLGAAQHKAAALGERAQTAAELVTAQKVAAVAASAAALAGGGTAIDQFAIHPGPPQRTPPAVQVEAKPLKEEVPATPAAPELAADPEPVATEPAPEPAPEPEPQPPPPLPPDPANEFSPGASAAPPASRAPAPAAPGPGEPAGRGFTPSGGASGSGSGNGEFAP